MRVLITGAAGFIGRALATAIVQAGRLTDKSGTSAVVDELILVDRHAVSYDLGCTIPVRCVTGNLSDLDFVVKLTGLVPDSVFHLAASLTLDTELHPAEAYAVNVGFLQALIEQSAIAPKIVFASSIAVFGGDLPPIVDDTTTILPQTTYGTHKAIVELLLADYSRKGKADGRSLRLPIVLVRERSNTPSVSDSIAALVREPLAGRDITCGLDPSTVLTVASARAVADALIGLHNISPSGLPLSRAMNLPALSVRVQEIVDTVNQCALPDTTGVISFQQDPVLQKIVDSWPQCFVSHTASQLGLGSDRCFADIVYEYMRDIGLHPPSPD